MANLIKLKRSAVPGKTPTVADLELGELAINTNDGKLFFEKDNGTASIVQLANAGINSDITELTGVTGGISSPDFIQFDISATVTPEEGKLWYNPEDDTLNLGMSGGVVQQVGQEFFMPPCKNSSGVVINNGDFIMATGVSGDKVTIAKAITDGTIAPEYMIGVATQQITVDSEVGMVCTNGIVRDIDTSAWPVGTILYPNPAVAGGLTSTKPSAPNIKTPIAIVLRQHASTGRILVRMSTGSVLGGTDSNVEFTALSNADLIVYNSTNSRWENKNLVNVLGYTPANKAGDTFTGQVNFDGNVGIGTSSPVTKLDIYGGSGQGRIQANVSSVNPSITLTADSTSGYYPTINFSGVGGNIGSFRGYANNGMFHNFDLHVFRSKAGTEYARITNTGNVGIGTTTPSSKLDISGGAGNSSVSVHVDSVNPAINLKADATNGYYPAIKFYGAGASGGLVSSIEGYGGVLLDAAGNGSVVLRTNGSERLRVNGSGNVGIGTSAPSFELDVKGAGATTSARIVGGGITTPPASGGTLTIHTLTNGVARTGLDISFTNGAASRLGGFKFSDTQTPGDWVACQMEMVQSYGAANEIVSKLQVEDASWAGMRFVSQTNAGAALATSPTFIWRNYTTEQMRISSTGNVSIGNTNDVFKLDVSGASTIRGDLNITPSSGDGILNFDSANVYNFLNFRNAGSTFASITGYLGNGLWQTADQHIFRTNYASPTERMRITAAGNVGIGTSSPSSKLHVAGSLTLDTALSPANGGTGTSTALTAGSIVFAGASGVYSQNNANLFWDDTNNRLGVGIATPASLIDSYGASSALIQVSGDTSAALRAALYSSNLNPPVMALRKSRGTLASPAAVGSNDQIGLINFQAFGGTNNRNLVQIHGIVDTYTSDSNISSYMTFSTSSPGSASATEKMRITSAGNVGIGTTTPNANGKVDILGNIDPGTTPAALSVRNTAAAGGTATDQYGIHVSSRTYNNATSGYGIYAFSHQNKATYGIWGDAGSLTLTGSASAPFYGVAGRAYFNSAASHALINGNLPVGVYGTVISTGSTNTATSAAGYFTNAATFGSEAYGIYVNVASGPTTTIAARFDFAGTEVARIDSAGGILSRGTGGIGYRTGAGGTVTQVTSRTTGVTINKTTGSITLVSAAGTTTWQSFTVTNSTVAATDVIKVVQRSGTDLYMIHVTNVAAGSFQITFATTGGTTAEQPVFNFVVIKGSTS